MNKTEFKAYDRVLVRDEDHERWRAAIYDQYVTTNGAYPHCVIGDGYFVQCIPYEGNEHLLGTTDRPEKPKLWRPKEGEDYYYIAWVASEGFVTMVETWLGHESFNPEVWEAGNCFRTEEEAQQLIDRMNEALEGILSPDAGKLFDRE